MRSFQHEFLPGRVVFSAGALAQIGAEADRLNATRALVIFGEPETELGRRTVEILDRRVAGTWNHVRQHVPTDLVDQAATHAQTGSADLLVSIGGGSTTGLAKALALRTGLPILAVPTTYAGSEMTPIWGLTENAVKTTGRDLAVLPKTVIYDPELTLTLPASISGASGVNALAHCVEATYATGASPITAALAVEATDYLTSSLPKVVADPADIGARSDALYGAFLAGHVLSTAGVSVHHHICHVLGGMFDLPHAELHTVILPHAVSAVAARKPDALDRLRPVLGHEPGRFLKALAGRLELPASLEIIGMTSDQVRAAIPRVVSSTANDVTPLDEDAAHRLLSDAFHGREPAQ